MSDISFDDRTQEEVAIPLGQAGFPITRQTFIRVYRVMPDGSEVLLTVARLKRGKPLTIFWLTFRSGYRKQISNTKYIALKRLARVRVSLQEQYPFAHVSVMDRRRSNASSWTSCKIYINFGACRTDDADRS